MIEIFQYSFILRGLGAGIFIGLLAPLIGMFLVLRRYSMMADTLAHVSLLGVALGLVTGISPLITAIVTSTLAATLIERLRTTRRIYGESALAIFLSGSLAIAIIIINVSRGFKADLFSYLFGSIVTVTQVDLIIIAGLGLVVSAVILGLYKELIYSSFDEESAQVSGIPTRWLNSILIILAAITVAIAMPTIGILLISALLVIPVVTALQLKLSFTKTLLWAEAFSVGSVITGMISSFYLNVAAGGAIIVVALFCFTTVLLTRKNISGK